MLGKHLMQANSKDYSNTSSTPDLLLPTNNKNYLNYVNFAPNHPNRQPDHVALYTLNPNSHPTPKNSNATNLSINRNPYINQPVELRKDPPKDTLARNTSTKDQFAFRQSQELVRKTQSLKSGHKSNSISSKGLNNNNTLHSSINKTANSKGNEQTYEMGNANYNQTVDLGSISRAHSTNLGEDEVLKQKIEYLQFLEQCLRQFQKYQDMKLLKNLNQDNRLLQLRYFEEINRIKDQRSRKTVSDLISESDNVSEDNFSMDSRNTSLRIHGEKNKFSQGFSRIRDNSQEKQQQLTIELRLNQKLQRQYKELTNSNSRQREIQKIESEIKNIEKEYAQLNIKNQELKQKLTDLPFYEEWILMNDQAEGARKTQLRLKQELKKRKQKLHEAKDQTNKEGSTQQCNYARKSQQARSREKIEVQKERQGSVSKNTTTMKPKMQPIPLPGRPIGNASSQLGGNRIIQDSSLRIMGLSNQSRNKSINQPTNN